MIINVAFDTKTKELIVSANGMKVDNISSVSFYDGTDYTASMSLITRKSKDDFSVYTEVQAQKLIDGVQE